MLPRTTVSDSDTAETAIEILRDAMHLHRLHSPDDPTRAVSTLANLASLMRSRLAGDPDRNVAEAIALFAEAITIADDVRDTRRLSTPDRILLGSNQVSGLADFARLRPDPNNDRALWNAMLHVDAQLFELHPEHPVRAMTLANFGAIALEMIIRESPALPQNPEKMGHRLAGRGKGRPHATWLPMTRPG